MVEPRWIGVEAHMPTMRVAKAQEEDGRDCLMSDYVLVWDGLKIEIAQAVSDESGVYWLDRLADVVKAVFWMPLPASPDSLKGDK